MRGKRPCTCERVTGPTWTPEQCRRCWLWHYDARHRAHWAGRDQPPPCIHLGEATGERRLCPSCTGHVEVKTFACARHGLCTTNKAVPGVACCAGGCRQKQPIAPLSIRRIEGLPAGRSFNASIAAWRGRTWLCYRRHWERARLALVELDSNWRPIGIARELPLGRLPQDRHAQEDPRLWVHRDLLHVSYSGCSWERSRLQVSVCVARLNEELQVEESYYPHFDRRQTWEKNWGFFSHHGDLHAVHTIEPHRVLVIHHGGAGELRAQPAVRLPGREYGDLRGGAPPVLVGGEYYSWFHGRTSGGSYSIGLYTFDAAPPFRPRRFLRAPLAWPEPAERPGPHVPDVVFPGGAVLRDGVWHVAAGYYDQEIRVYSWDAGEVEKLLEPV